MTTKNYGQNAKPFYWILFHAILYKKVFNRLKYRYNTKLRPRCIVRHAVLTFDQFGLCFGQYQVPNNSVKMKNLNKTKEKKRKIKKKIIDKNNKSKVLVVAQEIRLARLLSGNEKKIRDKVLKTLKKWLSSCFNKDYGTYFTS